MYQSRLSLLTEKIANKIAGILPKKVVYFAAVRLIAFGTTGKYGNTVVPELSAMNALKRYGNAYMGHGCQKPGCTCNQEVE